MQITSGEPKQSEAEGEGEKIDDRLVQSRCAILCIVAVGAQGGIGSRGAGREIYRFPIPDIITFRLGFPFRYTPRMPSSAHLHAVYNPRVERATCWQ